MQVMRTNPLHRLTLSSLLVAALLVGAVVAASFAASAVFSTQVECSDFRNQRQAQRFFRRHDPRADPQSLANVDNVACQHLRCPCSRRVLRRTSATVGFGTPSVQRLRPDVASEAGLA